MTVTITNQTKHSTSPSNQSKNSATLSNYNKLGVGSKILKEDGFAILTEAGYAILRESDISYSVTVNNLNKS